MTSDRQPAVEEERTVDAFLGGRITLVQPRKGHRAGLDAALLQALVPSTAAGLAVDLGAGIGTVAFCLAARAPGLSVIGIERDADLVAFGQEALARPENASFSARARLIEGDVAKPSGLFDAPADFVLMNPPFDPADRGSRSPDARRRDAHIAAEGLLESWIAAASSLLKPGGMLGLIHRADALRQVLAALSHSFGDTKIMPVHPAESAAAIRVLATAKRGSRAPLSILPGLVLHQPDGAWTARADALLRGEGELATHPAH